jgi:hypothetical protein
VQLSTFLSHLSSLLSLSWQCYNVIVGGRRAVGESMYSISKDTVDESMCKYRERERRERKERERERRKLELELELRCARMHLTVYEKEGLVGCAAPDRTHGMCANTKDNSFSSDLPPDLLPPDSCLLTPDSSLLTL